MTLPSATPRVLYLLSHPIQYQSPMLRYLTLRGRIDIHTLYTHRGGTSGYFDEDFGRRVTWDVPLTEGHSHQFLPGIGERRSGGRLTPWARGLWDALYRFRPDAVWLHGYDHANAVRMLWCAKLAGLPVLVRAEVEESDAHGGVATRILKDNMLRGAFRYVDAFLAIGSRNRRFYIDRGVSATRIFSVPYAVENARFQEAASVAASQTTLAEEYKMPPSYPVFMYSGKLIERKRPLDCVRALAQLRDKHGINASLLIVGSGELLDSTRQLVAKLRLEDRVRFAGFLNQSKIASCYARAHALLLTSSRERWGLVANEAMAARCPVITYRAVGCSDDLVMDGLSGLVVPTGSEPDLSAAMARLCDPLTHSTLVKGAERRVSDFSFERIEEGLMEALRAVVR